jgi:phosphoribosylformylglycinamidine synthase subunit PurS
MKAIVHVGLKPGVLDPQGKAVADSLSRMGFDEVADVRIGKVIELELEGTPSRQDAEARVKAMCDKLLANTVIESYRIELV